MRALSIVAIIAFVLVAFAVAGAGCAEGSAEPPDGGVDPTRPPSDAAIPATDAVLPDPDPVDPDPTDPPVTAMRTPGPIEPPATGDPWSSPATWGGRVPGPGDDVVVPLGRTILLDTDVNVRSITVEGLLATMPTFRKRAWAELASGASAGTTRIDVYDATGWAVGDELVVTPSSTSDAEFDVATVRSLTTAGRVTTLELDAPLRYGHDVVTLEEPDPGHPSGHVTFSPEVLDLTRTRRVETTRFVVRNTGGVYLEDLVVVGTGIDWNDTPRGGVCRGVVVRDVVKSATSAGGTGFVIEGGANVLWEETIVYNVSGTVGDRLPLAAYALSPNDGRNKLDDDVFCVRCVAARITASGGSNGFGFDLRGLGHGGSDDAAHLRAGIVGSVVVGVRGGESAGYRTHDGTGGGLQYFWQNEAHACGQGIFIDGNGMAIYDDGQPFVDVQLWRNRGDGLFWGAYRNDWSLHHFYLLGNLASNVTVLQVNANWSRFVLDGEGVTPVGLHFIAYIAPAFHWAPYVRTTFRGHADVDISSARSGTAANLIVEFPLSDPPVPTNDFCATALDRVIAQEDRFLVNEDEMRFDTTTFAGSECPGQIGARETLRVPTVDVDPSEDRFIQFGGSAYRYIARRTKNAPSADIADHLEGLEDWSTVREELLP